MLASSPLAAGPIASASQAVQTAVGAGVVVVDSSGVGILILNGSATAEIEVRSEGNVLQSVSHIPNMQSSIWVNTNGTANLIASAPVSRTIITVHSTGEFTFGDYHYGSGQALAAALFSTGSIQALPYVYASGSAAVSVKMIDQGYGIPPIPSLFISAPSSRTMYAPPSGRTMYAGKNRRTLP